MKILLVAPSVVSVGTGRYGGIEKLLYDFAAGLVGASNEVTVAAPVGSKVPGGTRLIETVVLPEQQDRDDLTADILRDCRSFEVIHDFSHLHGVSRRNGGLPAVFHVWHPMVHRYYTPPYNVVCVSDWQRERFELLYRQQARTMPLLVNTDVYRPALASERRRFLYLGNISPQKGVHLAIQFARNAGVELDVVGGLIPSEWASPYLRAVADLCDGDRIRFHFNVTEDEKVGFIQQARAAIYPVQQEEAGWLAGLEAWACGTPTIAFDRGSMSSILPALPRISCVVRTEAEFLAKMLAVPDTGEVDGFTDWVREFHSSDRVLSEYSRLYSDVAHGLRWS